MDYLRLIAALSVVGYHYFFNGIVSGRISEQVGPAPFGGIFKYGYYGVWLFFLISGFVVTNSARNRTAAQFAVGRFVRLYPAFWFVIGLELLFHAALPDSTPAISLRQLLANLTMVPAQLGEEPISPVYWTLVFELQFYAMVFVLLLLGFGRHLDALWPLWAFAILGMQLVYGLDNPPGVGLGSYFALFATGAVLAAARERGLNVYRACGIIAGASASVLFGVRLAPVQSANRGGVGAEPWVVGVLLVAMFVVFAVLTLGPASQWRLPFSLSAGALTYPVYLVHDRMGYALLAEYASPRYRWFAWGLLIAGVLVVSWLIHRYVEQRPAALWRRVADATVGRAARGLQRGVDLLRSRSRARRTPADAERSVA